MKATILVAALVAAGLAGCISTELAPGAVPGCSPGGVDDDGIFLGGLYDPVIPVGQDPWDFQATNIRSCTLDAIARHPLRFDNAGEPDPHRYLGEIDMRGDLDLGAVAVLGVGEAPAVYLLDITQRDAPLVWSRIDQYHADVVDVKLSDDGRFLFTASQQSLARYAVPPSTNLPDAPPADLGQVVATSGFTVYDIQDPASPEMLLTVPSPDDWGCHMLDYAFIDGTHVVACIGQHVNLFGLAEVGGRLVNLGSVPYVVEKEGAPCPSNTVQPVGSAEGNLCSGPHDATITLDPVDQRRYMVVSHWDSGVRVVDVTAPIGEGIEEVGAWTGDGAQHYAGYVHTAMMFYVGGDRYIAATPECTGPCTPALWILDATDLADLRLVGEWTHPQMVETTGLLMTLHQWQVAPTGTDVAADEVRIYITWNHNGVWVLDFGEILAGDDEKAILGYHMSREPLDQDEEVGNAVLSTWDLNVVDGYIYGSDRATGLWVFHYYHDRLGDERLRGFG